MRVTDDEYYKVSTAVDTPAAIKHLLLITCKLNITFNRIIYCKPISWL